MKMHKCFLGGLALVGVVLTSCDNGLRPTPQNTTQSIVEQRTRQTPEQFAAAEAARAKVGLPTLNADWYLYRKSPTQEDWKLRHSDFISKSVFLSFAGDAIIDDNQFYSGAQHEVKPEYGFEFIGVRYEFQSGQMVISYFGSNATTKATLEPFLMLRHGPTTNYSAAMAAVNMVLSTWPIPRKGAGPPSP